MTDRIIKAWQVTGLVLKAGDGTIPVEALLEFATEAAATHPGNVVQITEFGLRVTTYEQEDQSVGPWLDWRDR